MLDAVYQRRDKPDPATYIGSGKALELRDLVLESGADTVVCDGELSPGQLIHLEDVVKVKVVDRTALILDIFAQHAKSREGKAQVSLAQMQYMLPRLRGWGQSLSRQMGGGGSSGGGGMATRGPGETKIETDRRRIREKMAKMRREIAEMKTGREIKRQERKRNKVPSVAIAGYTNAGKSSLLNRLTGAGVLVENSCSPPWTRPSAGPRRRAAGSTPWPTPSGSSGTCRTTSSRRSAPPWRRSASPISSSMWWTAPTRCRRSSSPRCAR